MAINIGDKIVVRKDDGTDHVVTVEALSGSDVATAIVNLPNSNLVTDDQLAAIGTVGDDRTVTIFVAKSGNDSTGDGSQLNPYLTIQKGVDASIEVAGHSINKVVRVKPGTGGFLDRAYLENVVVNTRGIEIVGHWGDDSVDVVAEVYAYVASGDRPPILYTNMTKAEAIQYSIDGGGDYTVGSSYSYDGGSLLSRQTWDKDNPNGDVNGDSLNQSGTDSTVIVSYFKLTSIIVGTVSGNIWGSHNVAFAAIVVPEVDTDLLVLGSDIILEDVVFSGPNPEIFCKNINKFQLEGETSCTVAHSGKMVFDNCTQLKLGATARMGGMVLNFDESSPNGAPYPLNFFGKEGNVNEVLSVDGSFLMLGHSNAGQSEMGAIRELHAHGDIEINGGFKLSGSLSGTVYMRSVTTKSDVIVNDGSELLSNRVDCDNLTINDGQVEILGGIIRGNLTVADGSSINLVGVIVVGDVVLGATASITWQGGSFYGTLTDPSGLLGSSVAGDYLNEN